METTSSLTETSIWLMLLMNYVAMLVFSIVAMLIASKGKLARWGFKLPDNLRLKSIVPLGLGIGISLTLIASSLPGEEISAPGELSFLQQVLLIWICASVCEEMLMRGLIQGSLNTWKRVGITLFGWRLSLPVIVGAVAFGLMHIALSTMGAGTGQVIVTVLFAFLLGLVAGYHRETSGSLLPAIIVHMFGNIGGSLAGFGIGLAG